MQVAPQTDEHPPKWSPLRFGRISDKPGQFWLGRSCAQYGLVDYFDAARILLTVFYICALEMRLWETVSVFKTSTSSADSIAARVCRARAGRGDILGSGGAVEVSRLRPASAVVVSHIGT
jgi:hypothetical protein